MHASYLIPELVLSLNSPRSRGASLSRGPQRSLGLPVVQPSSSAEALDFLLLMAFLPGVVSPLGISGAIPALVAAANCPRSLLLLGTVPALRLLPSAPLGARGEAAANAETTRQAIWFNWIPLSNYYC